MEFKEITDKEKWNSFVENFNRTSAGVPRSNFIQSYEWADFQEKNHNKAFRFAVTEGEEILGVALAVMIKAKRGKYLYIRNGPVIDWNNKELADFMIKNLKEFAVKNGLWFIRMSPLVEKESTEATYLKSLNHRENPMNDVDALDTWLLDVTLNEEEILAAAKKKNRYEIKQSLKDELTAEVYQSSEKLYIFYSILEDTVKRQNWNSYSFEYIKNEFESFSKSNNASLILVKYEEKYIAGGIFIHFADQTAYHYGASLSEYNKVPGPYRVIWEAIRESKKRNIKYLNFWGIAPEDRPDHPWTGLTRFKKKFPGFEQRWMSSIDLPLSPLYNLTNIFERIDKTRKGY